MNAILNITVRVAGRDAINQLNQVDQAVKKLGSGSGAGLSGFFSQMEGWNNKLQAFGKNLQWTGRQLEYAFTLPIVGAGVAAAKFALDAEAGATQLRKVYGLVGESASQTNTELKQLDTTVDLLSRRFGVQRAQVYDVAKAWAEAGMTGVGLARAVQNSLEASIIGSIDLEKATTGLIAVQSAYKLNTVEMRNALADLDLIQTQSGINFGGLIDVIQRAGSTAAVAGVDFRHLAAMAAAIVPAAGTAAQAGNSLRTILSRILVPSKDAADLLNEIGLNVTQAAWSTKTGTERFEMLAKAVSKLPDSKKIIVDTFVAGRFQLNRFTTLLEDAINVNGLYQRSLRNTADPVKALNTYQQQLNTVLDSNPQKLKIIGVTLQNSLANVIAPMLPSILGLATRIVGLVTAFTHLSPEVQQFILTGLALLAITGPLVRYIGAFALLAAQLGKVMIHTGQAVGWTVLKFRDLAAAIRISASEGLIGVGIQKMIGLWWKLVGVVESVWTTIFGTTAAAEAATMGEIEAGGAAAFGTIELEAVGAMDAIAASTGAAGGLVVAEFGGMAAGVEAEMLALTAAVETEVLALEASTAAGASTALVLFGQEEATLQAAVVAAMTEVGTATASMGSEWVATMSTIVADTVIAGNEITTIWVGVMGGIEEIWIGELLSMEESMKMAMAAMRNTAAIGTGAIDAVIVGEMLALPPAAAAIGALTGGALALGVGAGAVGAGAAVAGVGEEMLALPAAAEAAGAGIGAAIGGWLAELGAVFGMIWTWIEGLFGANGLIASAFLEADTFIGGLVGAFGAVGEAVAGIAALIVSLPADVIIALVAIGAAVVILAIRFRNELGGAVKWVMDGFAKLPSAVGSAMIATVKVIAEAIQVAIHWLSYLNPFARHSPSLVDYVNMGTAVISDRYRQLAMEITASLGRAVQAHKAFGAATAGTQDAFDAAEYQSKRNTIVKYLPSAAPATDLLIASIVNLKGVLRDLDPEIEAQEVAVAKWGFQLDAAKAQVDAAQKVLEGLRRTADATKNELDDAKNKLADFAKTPIQGMKAMQDQIFANTMAQKQLQLEILKMEDSYGSLDKINSKLAALQGQLELVRGQAKDLRQSGAGSDILKTYDDEAAAIERQQTALQDQAKQFSDLTDQLEKLQRQGQELDLENSLQFDPLKKQIDDVANAMTEMPFDEILKGVQDQRAAVDRLTPVWEQQNQAVMDQQKVVDNLTAARDNLQASYDAENDKLSALKQSYSDVKDQIDAMEQSLTSMSSSISAANQKGPDQTQAEKLFNAPAADFPDVTGNTLLGQNEAGSLDEFNKQLQKAIEDAGKGFGKLDPFKPLKDKWNDFTKWLGNIGGDIAGPFIASWNFAWRIIAGVIDATWSGIKTGSKAAWEGITTAIGASWDALQAAAKFLGGVLKGIWDAIAGAATWVWQNVLYPIFNTIGSVINSTVVPALQFLGAIFAAVWGAIAAAASWAWDNVLHPVLSALVDFFNNYIKPPLQLFVALFQIAFALVAGIILITWNQLIKPVLDAFVWTIENGPGAAVSWLWNTIIQPVFKAIGDFLGWVWSNVIKPVFDAIVWFIQNVLGPVFSWILNEIVIPIFNQIGDTISFAWNDIIKPIFDALVWALQNVVGPAISWLYDNIVQPVFKLIGEAISGAWNDVIKPIFDGVVWFIQNVLAPVFSWLKDKVIDPIFHGIADIISSVWGGITDSIKNAANFFIDAFNTIADGVKAVADFIGIKVTIDHMPRIGEKSGGTGGDATRQVGRAFAAGGLLPETDIPMGVFKGVRAIVGEGNPAYPEYVIPTDPRYRRRAQELYRNAGTALMASGGIVPSKPEQGGIGWHTITDVADDAWGAIRKGAVMAVAQPFLAAADVAISAIPDKTFRAGAGWIKNEVYNWLKGEDSKAHAPTLGGGKEAGVGDAATGPLIDFMKGTGVPFRVTATTNGVHAAGSLHYQGRAVDFAGLTPGYDSPELARIDQAFKSVAPQLAELIYAGPGAIPNIKNGQPFQYTGDILGEHHDHVHAALKNGGIVRGSTLGTLVRAGDGNQDEMIKPLPRDATVDGGVTNNFYGDLSFPNVRTGDDAADFLDNLKSVS